MEPADLGGSSTRKVRFAPKAPPPRRKKAVLPKVEEDVPNEASAQAAQDLLRRFNEHLGRRGPKVEKKSSVRVAFGHGAESSTSIKSYGKLREGGGGGIGIDPALNDATRTNEQITVLSPSTTSIVASSLVPVDASSSRKIKKDYKEPWDYHHSDYPITLPLRRPYSGDPEQLDEKEFGKGAELDYDEGVTNSAAELGLLDENEDEKMLFLQFPPNLPFVRRRTTADGHIEREDDIAGSSVPLEVAVSSASAQGKERVGSSRGLGVSPTSKGSEMVGSFVRPKRSPLMKGCSFEELPAGYMGKMLVYKSGAIKLKLGDTLYDVSPGSDCIFAQDIVAINTADEECCRMGEIGKRAVVTPDIDSLLADEMDLS